MTLRVREMKTVEKRSKGAPSASGRPCRAEARQGEDFHVVIVNYLYKTESYYTKNYREWVVVESRELVNLFSKEMRV